MDNNNKISSFSYKSPSVTIFGGLGYVGDPLIESLKDDYDVSVVDPNWYDNLHESKQQETEKEP